MMSSQMPVMDDVREPRKNSPISIPFAIISLSSTHVAANCTVTKARQQVHGSSHYSRLQGSVGLISFIVTVVANVAQWTSILICQWWVGASAKQRATMTTMKRRQRTEDAPIRSSLRVVPNQTKSRISAPPGSRTASYQSISALDAP